MAEEQAQSSQRGLPGPERCRRCDSSGRCSCVSTRAVLSTRSKIFLSRICGLEGLGARGGLAAPAFELQPKASSAPPATATFKATLREMRVLEFIVAGSRFVATRPIRNLKRETRARILSCSHWVRTLI